MHAKFEVNSCFGLDFSPYTCTNATIDTPCTINRVKVNVKCLFLKLNLEVLLEFLNCSLLYNTDIEGNL